MTEELLSEAWKKSRSGAWAHRGFHYQHLVITLVVLRQWLGLAPSGFVVPEGLEDCVVELASEQIRIQIKSRSEGWFRENEVRTILTAMSSEVRSTPQIKARCVVVLEQNRQGITEWTLESLLAEDNPDVIVCKSPQTEIISLLSAHLGAAEIIVESIASDIYRLVAEAAAFNATVPFENRRRFSTMETEKRINELLTAQDPSAIDEALISGALKSVDFLNPINEAGFYLGTKVQPGHIAAGLVVPRPAETDSILEELRRRRHVVLSAPSGAGKSALLWLAVSAFAGKVRWWQITASATMNDVSALMRFVHSRRPSDDNLIGLVFDDLAPTNIELWNVLSHELKAVSGIYLLGSIRSEDADLLTAQSEISIIHVELSDRLAEAVWKRLRIEQKTTWEHWREPFEQSGGLMLEYVHILTQGRRLGDVIAGQIRQREREGRDDELAIIRSTSAIFSRGGEIEVAKLIERLDIPAVAASQALRRLLDEHLIRENRPGILGGLHALRSAALCHASHDETIYLSLDSLWKGIEATTVETIPLVVQSVFSGVDIETATPFVKKIAGMLGPSNDVDFWSAMLTGLGLASLEEHALTFISILEEHEVPKANWSLAAMFSDPKLDIPDLAERENWVRVRRALLAYRATRKRDMREICLDSLSANVRVPPCTSFQEATKLFSCLAPLSGGTPIDLTMVPDISGDGEPNIKDMSAMLAAAYHLNPKLAVSLVASFGGEDALLAAFYHQTPWITEPKFESGSHGKTIRSNWFLLTEEFQSEPHETICNICETLIALTPSSEAAASDVISAQGTPLRVGTHTAWSKNMPRENIPAPSRVAWNRAFLQIVTARSTAGTLTSYAGEMARLVVRAEKVFRIFSEAWIKGKQRKDTQAIADEVNDIIGCVNNLAYAAPKRTSTPGSVTESVSDTVGALLNGILGNLMGRLHKITAETGVNATAAFAADLAEQAESHANSTIWRTVSNPPTDQLQSMARRLADAGAILREFGVDSSSGAVQAAIKVAKKADLGRAISAAARRARALAEQRMNGVLKRLESALRQSGSDVRCATKPCKKGLAFWPAKEVAILLGVENFEQYNSIVDRVIAVGREHLKGDWLFKVAPIINGKIIAPAAIYPSSELILPDQQFEQEWQGHAGMPFVATSLVQSFEKAFSACVEASGIFLARGVVTLHVAEDEALSRIIGSFDRQLEILENAARDGAAHRKLAFEYVDQLWARLMGEFNDLKAGLTISEPLCMSPHGALTGKIDQTTAEVAYVKFQILEGEARAA